TFPQLEYPRRWAPWMKVTGPLMWEQPFGDVEPPPGDDPLVLVAPSTSQDPEQRMLRAALDGLAGERVRVLATTNRRPPEEPLDVPPNARVVDWLSYSRTMPLCDAVVCHAGHGTVVRALASGTPLVACPAAGDMAENAARVAWAGVGVPLPRRLTTPRGIRLALRRLLDDPGYSERAGELARWAAAHDGPATAADELERFVERRRSSG
ncbi:MAG: glycosyltransferase, partial [Thermoleophilaceae bacterium]